MYLLFVRYTLDQVHKSVLYRKVRGDTIELFKVLSGKYEEQGIKL